VVRNATLVDAVSAPRPDHAVLIVGDRIQAVGPSASLVVPPGARVLDAAGGVVIPGLWDMHGHVAGYQGALGLLLAHGVTGVRDMGNATAERSREIAAWQREIAEGRRAGPRIVAAGPTLDGPRGITSAARLFVAEAADAGGALDTIRARGAAFAKVHDWLTRDAYLALARAARESGLPVAGHVPPALTALEVAAAGQASIEHLGSALGGVLLDASSREAEQRGELLARMQRAREARSEAELWRWALGSARLAELASSWDDARADALVDAFPRHGTWHCPTLVVLSPAGRPRDDSARRYVYGSAVAQCRDAATASPEPSRVRRDVFARQLRFAGQLQRGGVGLLAGTDFVRPDREALEEFETCDVPLAGLSLHEELEWLVEAGLSPREALAAATSGPARYFGEAARAGRVEAGQRADLVVLDASPLDDIRNTRRITAVVREGRLLDRAALDALLAAAAEEARAN
jgi:predicted amidohydrolase YtcJ